MTSVLVPSITVEKEEEKAYHFKGFGQVLVYLACRPACEVVITVITSCRVPIYWFDWRFCVSHFEAPGRFLRLGLNEVPEDNRDTQDVQEC